MLAIGAPATEEIRAAVREPGIDEMPGAGEEGEEQGEPEGGAGTALPPGVFVLAALSRDVSRSFGTPSPD